MGELSTYNFSFAGEIVDLIGETHGIHTVASLLKGYLRSLPEPVIPFYYYEELRTVTKSKSKLRLWPFPES